jgi:hypothetical protein
MLMDDIFAGEPEFLLHVAGVAEDAVARIEVVVGPPRGGKQHRKNTATGTDPIYHNLLNYLFCRFQSAPAQQVFLRVRKNCPVHKLQEVSTRTTGTSTYLCGRSKTSAHAPWDVCWPGGITGSWDANCLQDATGSQLLHGAPRVKHKGRLLVVGLDAPEAGTKKDYLPWSNSPLKW